MTQKDGNNSRRCSNREQNSDGSRQIALGIVSGVGVLLTVLTTRLATFIEPAESLIIVRKFFLHYSSNWKQAITRSKNQFKAKTNVTNRTKIDKQNLVCFSQFFAVDSRSILPNHHCSNRAKLGISKKFEEMNLTYKETNFEIYRYDSQHADSGPSVHAES